MMGATILPVSRNLIFIAVDMQQLTGSGCLMSADHLGRMDNRPARETCEQA